MIFSYPQLMQISLSSLQARNINQQHSHFLATNYASSKALA